MANIRPMGFSHNMGVREAGITRMGATGDEYVCVDKGVCASSKVPRAEAYRFM